MELELLDCWQGSKFLFGMPQTVQLWSGGNSPPSITTHTTIPFGEQVGATSFAHHMLPGPSVNLLVPDLSSHLFSTGQLALNDHLNAAILTDSGGNTITFALMGLTCQDSVE